MRDKPQDQRVTTPRCLLCRKSLGSDSEPATCICGNGAVPSVQLQLEMVLVPDRTPYGKTSPLTEANPERLYCAR